MLRKLKEILGVGDRYLDSASPPQKLIGVDEMPDTAASRRRDPDPRTSPYLPERLVPLHGAEGVAPDGSVWLPWREETATGEKWYRRVSYLPGEGQQDIDGGQSLIWTDIEGGDDDSDE